MIVDPRVGMWLSIALAILGVMAGGGASLTDLFGEHTTKIILAVVTLVMGGGNAVNAILHAIPAVKPVTNAAADQFPLGPKA